jgi:hypothetical protein
MMKAKLNLQCQLTVKSMQEAIDHISKGSEIFCSNEPNWQQSSSHPITYHQMEENHTYI